MEYIKFAFTGANLFSTLFLCAIMFYWGMVIVGFFGLDTFDFNYDFDAELDLDVDLDLEIDNNLDLTSIGSSTEVGNFFLKILKFSNITYIPLMIYLSVFFLCLWTLSMLTFYFKINAESFIGLLVLLQNIILTFLITKVLTNPLKKLFMSMENTKSISYIGKESILITDLRQKGIGQAQFIEENFPYVFNVSSLEEGLKKGDRVMVVSKNEEKGIFIVKRIKGD